MNLVFKDNWKKIFYEVEEVSGKQIIVNFSKEFIEGRFYSDIIPKPS